MKKKVLLDLNGVLILHPLWGSSKTNKELLQYLISKKDQYSYVLLTNNPPEIKEHIEAVYGIPKFYDHFISSQAYGLSKSDPKLYEEVLALLLATPEQCIFVDDEAQRVEAARSLGIKGIVYQNFEQFKKELEKLN